MCLVSIIRALPMLLLAGILTGCSIFSVSLLVADDDNLATPLPAAFDVVAYQAIADGTYRRQADERPRRMVRDGRVYRADDGSMALRLVARKDGSYLLAASSGGGDHPIYGLATIHGEIVAVRMVVDNEGALPGLVSDALRTADAATRTALEGMRADGEGLRVTTRAGLDKAIDWVADGTIKTRPLLMFVSPRPETAPDTIVPDGTNWVGR